MPSSHEAVEWICERCKAVFGEYVNGCPKCWHGNNGMRSRVVAIPLDEVIDFIMQKAGERG